MADLVTAFGEFTHSLTLPGFQVRAAGTAELVGQVGVDDFELHMGEYIGIATRRA